MITKCTCGVKRLTAVGPAHAKVLIIGDFPEYEDMMKGIPFGGKRGDVLYGELARVGLLLPSTRLTYVWQHTIPNVDKVTGKRPCDGHMTEAIKEMKDRDGVLIVGATTVEAFGLGHVGDLSGLCVSSVYFPKSAGFVMVATNPPTSDCVGEFRLAIEKFSKKLKEVKRD